jgi:hypothetical protein
MDYRVALSQNLTLEQAIQALKEARNLGGLKVGTDGYTQGKSSLSRMIDLLEDAIPIVPIVGWRNSVVIEFPEREIALMFKLKWG